jgi:endonuclease/exonuclease/phosphatase family metal-dependent hydrolase
MQYRTILNYALFLLAAFAGSIFASAQHPGLPDEHRGHESLRVVFYNVENLFDPFRDSLINDQEFTSGGIRAWSYTRFNKKCQDLGKVLIATGGWEAPEIIGLCEVENHFVLRKLLEYSALSRLSYRIVHYDSPDSRGIDVALLYRPEKFHVLHSEAVAVIFPGEDSRSTRDILYVKGIALDADTLHCFVNHWPSRFGGYMATKPLREFTGALLRSRVDSILAHDSGASILVMGDFNDPPDEHSMQFSLGARLDSTNMQAGDLYNLMSQFYRNPDMGTLKFQGNWSTIDQFIVSRSLLRAERRLGIRPGSASIFDAAFLLEDDPTYPGRRVNRTYIGMQYHGGYSDHLPIVVDVFRKQ